MAVLIRHFTTRTAPLLFLLVGTPALSNEASEAARCRWLEAEARSTAATLLFPRLEAQVLRFPGTSVDGTPVVLNGEPVQLRGFVAYSPVDFIRGRTLMSVAEADCRLASAESRLQRRVRLSESTGKANALKSRLGVLEGAVARAQALTVQTERRLERQAATVLQVEELRRKGLQLQMEASEVRAEIARLEALLPEDAQPASIREELGHLRTATLDAQTRRGNYRKLQAWQLDFRLGVEPVQNLEFIGMVTLGFNLGRLFQSSAEEEALLAREVEMRESDAEVTTQATRISRWLREDVPRLQQQLAVINEEIAHAKKNEAALASRASDPQNHVLALAELNRFELEAERAYLTQLVEARKRTGDLP